MGIRLVVADIDGVLVENELFWFFGNGHGKQMEKRPFLKRCAFRLVEIIEFILMINHKRNEKQINLIRALRRTRGRRNNLHLCILTDRSPLGLRNVRDVIASLKLGEHDYIQVRGGKNKISQNIPPFPVLNHCSSLKPHRSCLYLVEQLRIKFEVSPKEVLVVDDDPEFLRVARTFFGFRTSTGID